MRRPTPDGVRLDLDRLLEVVDVDMVSLAAVIGVSDRQVRRAKVDGLAVATADRWAVAAGHHPSAVWAEWWIVSTGATDG